MKHVERHLLNIDPWTNIGCWFVEGSCAPEERTLNTETLWSLNLIKAVSSRGVGFPPERTQTVRSHMQLPETEHSYPRSSCWMNCTSDQNAPQSHPSSREEDTKWPTLVNSTMVCGETAIKTYQDCVGLRMFILKPILQETQILRNESCPWSWIYGEVVAGCPANQTEPTCTWLLASCGSGFRRLRRTPAIRSPGELLWRWVIIMCLGSPLFKPSSFTCISTKCCMSPTLFQIEFANIKYMDHTLWYQTFCSPLSQPHVPKHGPEWYHRSKWEGGQSAQTPGSASVALEVGDVGELEMIDDLLVVKSI